MLLIIEKELEPLSGFFLLCFLVLFVLVTIVTEIGSDRKFIKMLELSSEQEIFIVCLLCWCASYLTVANLDLNLSLPL